MKKIAIITGASSGMGAEFARQIAALNTEDEIWIVARRLEKLTELAKQINESRNFEVIRPIELDLGTSEGVFAFEKLLLAEKEKLTSIESRFVITKLVNNAGFGTYGPFDETSLERQMSMIDLNCTSLTGMTGVCMPFFDKGSLIINTASLAAFWPLGNFAVYSASKSYVLNFSLALAAELKDKGIRVCAFCPGSVSTEFANVASDGARKEVKGGYDCAKTVRHCIKKALKGKHVILMAWKWKRNAFLAKFLPGYWGARLTFKYSKRPHVPVIRGKAQDEVSIDEFM